MLALGVCWDLVLISFGLPQRMFGQGFDYRYTGPCVGCFARPPPAKLLVHACTQLNPELARRLDGRSRWASGQWVIESVQRCSLIVFIFVCEVSSVVAGAGDRRALGWEIGRNLFC